MAKIVKATVFFVLVLAGYVHAQSNLCFNGNFNHTNSPLEGWNYDYRWLGNANYMGNYQKVSVLPEYKGKKNVLYFAPAHQVKVESKPIPIEHGFRYKCTFDVCSIGGVRCYFNCYKWEPGVAPYPDPKLGDLRRVYKGEPFVGGPGNWTTVTIYLPLEEISELAEKHYKTVRFACVYFLSDHSGGAWFANVKVFKTRETYKVIKSDIKDKTAVKAQFRKPDSKKPEPKRSAKEEIDD